MVADDSLERQDYTLKNDNSTTSLAYLILTLVYDYMALN